MNKGKVHIAQISAIRLTVTLQPARVRCMIVTKNKQPTEIERTKQKLVR